MTIIDQPHPAVLARDRPRRPSPDGTVDVDSRCSCEINLDPYGYRWLRVSEPGTRRLT